MEPKKVEEPKVEEKEEKKEEAKKPEEPKPEDLYWAWVKANPIAYAYDVAAFKQSDGVILVFTDPLGRSILNTAVFVPNKVLDTVNKLVKKV